MILNNKITRLIIASKDTILYALKRMDNEDTKLLIIIDDNEFVGLVSIGDIQRAIIRNIKLETQIIEIIRSNFYYATTSDNIKVIKQKMLIHRDEYMPIVDKNNNLVDVIFWDDVITKEEIVEKEKINLPIVIMAGGKGTRLKPLTNIIPKPLIPLGEFTIIEEIMNRFTDVGCNDFFISVNYKADTIKHYFSQINNSNYNISYFQESKPLGTAGSLYLVKDKIKTTFFVSNCDIIVKANYHDILKFHKENSNELTIVSALKHYSIPYGIIETEQGGFIKALKEKPELTFQINTGFYILEPHLLNEIPENKFLHITTLIEQIRERNGRVGVFPVSQGSWVDIGEWDEYIRTIEKSNNEY